MIHPGKQLGNEGVSKGKLKRSPTKKYLIDLPDSHDLLVAERSEGTSTPKVS